MWRQARSNNSLRGWFFLFLMGLQPVFFSQATAACAVARPQDMSSGTQLSDLIRNRVEFEREKKNPIAYLSPPPTSTDCKH